MFCRFASYLEYLGGTGERKFVDATLPTGSSAVIHQIQAIRSTVAGPVATFNVNFGGVNRAGGASATLKSIRPPRVAA